MAATQSTLAINSPQSRHIVFNIMKASFYIMGTYLAHTMHDMQVIMQVILTWVLGTRFWIEYIAVS